MSKEEIRDSLPFELTILGVNAATPAFGRHPSAQILQVQEKYYLVDCGEGTQMQMLNFGVKRSKINQIFISHLHGDHVYGLIGLLTSLGLNGRTAALEIFSPGGLKEMIDIQISYSGGGLPYPIQFHEVDTTQNTIIFEDQLVRVYSIPLQHRVPTNGFLFTEKERPRNIIGDKIKEYKIPYQVIPSIKSGADFTLPDGRVVPNEELTIAPPIPRSYAYCSDTRFTESIIPLIKGVDLLYHEATFCSDAKEQAEVSMHSTAQEAATIALKAGVGKLILGHFSSRYRDLSLFKEEAIKIFPESIIGEEGGSYAVTRNRT